MKITHPYYPIVYIRGYAASINEIEDTVATPYMGFNLGSTKLRQDHKGEIKRHIFESPLIRLMKDEGYVDTYQGGDFFPESKPVPAKSIWIYRYYEKMSQQLGEGERHDIPEAAAGLREFVLRIRKQVCGDDAEALKAFRVYLIAHSMGGLVARCYLQNICIYGSGDGQRDRDLELPGDSLVDKVFTWATPHNGIEFGDINVPDVGSLDRIHLRNFNRSNMQDYLKLPDAGTDYVNDLGGHFPADRFFCMVGSNAADYSEFLSLSKRATGAMSDGLVMIKNATVKDAPRAFAHRSHSGHFGIVNSEEGYQNLRRFLFGQFRVDVRLLVDEITLPDPIQKAKDKGKQIRASYYIETRAGVRNAGYHLNQRSVSNSSAILRDYDSMVKQHNPVRLLSAYLLRSARSPDAGDSALAFAIRVGIQVPLYEVDQRFRFDEYYEGGYLFDETVTLKVRSGKEAAASVSYGLASRQGPGVATRRIDAMPVDPVKGAEEYLVPLGFRQGMTNPPRPGFRGKLQITVTPWNVNPG